MAEDYEQTLGQERHNKGLEVSFLKKASDSHVLVAALVATYPSLQVLHCPAGILMIVTARPF